MRFAAPLVEFVAEFTRGRPATTRDKARELGQAAWVADPSAARRDFGWEASHDLLRGMIPTTQHYFAQEAAVREMPAEPRSTRWAKYLTIATILGILIEIGSATGQFYRFEPAWLVLLIIFGAFGLALGSLAMVTRRWGGLAQFLVGTAAAGAVELLNALNLTTAVRWIFTPGWPFGIDDPIGRALVLGLAGGVFVLLVNAIMRSLYRRRLRYG